MTLRRREFLSLAACAAGLPALAPTAWSQSYPSRPVRIVVGFAAGGGVDIVARLIAQALSERLGQQFLVENRPGAASNIGTETVVNAAPDGYTLLLVSVSAAINATLYEKLNFSLARDIAPVAGIMHVPGVLEVNPSFPAKTVPEFIGFAKANPGKLNMASAGIGTLQHVCGELFKMMTGVQMVHVPYRGSAPALTDLISGQVHVTFDPLPSSIEQIRSGKLRALAVTTAKRADTLPDVPAVGEFVAGFDAGAWYGVGAPRNTPAEVIDKLNAEINAVLAVPGIKTRLAELGGSIFPGPPGAFGKLIIEDIEKWGKVIRAAKIKPE